MRASNRAQLITFDFITGTFVFVVVILVLVGMILTVQKFTGNQGYDFEFEYIFANLENNLKHDPDAGLSFLDGNRVSAARLNNFVDKYLPLPGTFDLDQYTIGRIGAAHGIGLDEAAYDSCLYFTDENGPMPLRPGLIALGQLKNGNPCNSAMPTKNPCEDYKRALSLLKPVLYDTLDPQNSKIIQMNIVVCLK